MDDALRSPKVSEFFRACSHGNPMPCEDLGQVAARAPACPSSHIKERCLVRCFHPRAIRVFPHPELPPGLPLCVDLDGTLVKSDTLVDSVLALARQNPRALLSIPAWLAGGKAAFKRHVTSAVTLDVAHLPYNQPLLRYLRARARRRPPALPRHRRRPLPRRPASPRTSASSPARPRLRWRPQPRRRQQARRLPASTSAPTSPTSATPAPTSPSSPSAEPPWSPTPARRLMSGLRSAQVTPAHIFRDQSTPLKAWLKAIRLHQWAKNTLIFLPLLLAHACHGPRAAGSLLGASLAFLAFGLCASATYIVNDLLDIEADRRHASKRRRPFAAGNLSAISGCAVVVLFLAAAPLLAFLIPHITAHFSTDGPIQRYATLKWLVALRRLHHRLLARPQARRPARCHRPLRPLHPAHHRRLRRSGVPISTWLGGFSIFFFLSLAFIKRFAELENLRARGAVPTNGRGYLIADIEQLRAFGTAAAYASVVVLTLYICQRRHPPLPPPPPPLAPPPRPAHVGLPALAPRQPRPAQRGPRRLRHHRQTLPPPRRPRHGRRPLRPLAISSAQTLEKLTDRTNAPHEPGTKLNCHPERRRLRPHRKRRSRRTCGLLGPGKGQRYTTGG